MQSLLSMKKQLKMHVLATGSQGNCTVIQYGDTALLVDAGISCRRIVHGLRDLYIDPATLSGVLLTHEHSDHVLGLLQFLKNYEVPFYATRGTWRGIVDKLYSYQHRWMMMPDKEWMLGDLCVEAFSVSHDAMEPVGFTLHNGRHKASFLTDTGIATERMIKHIESSHLLVLESNYDEEMLKYGPYYPALKQRVAGKLGHLSNEAAAQVLEVAQLPSGAKVVLAHRSEKNNTIRCIEDTFKGRWKDSSMLLDPGIAYYHGSPKDCISIKVEEGI